MRDLLERERSMEIVIMIHKRFGIFFLFFDILGPVNYRNYSNVVRFSLLVRLFFRSFLA